MKKNRKTKELVSVVILNYNGKNVLLSCIQSIMHQEYKNIEVIVIDNASSDNSINLAKKKFSSIKTVINPSNLGFGKALNRGIKEAKGKYIICLNNDTKLLFDTIPRLINTIQQNPLTAISFPTEIPIRTKKEDAGQDGVVFELNGYQFRSVTKDNCYLEPNGACFMMKNPKEGIFCEEYFLFGEEYYLGFGQNCMGKKVVLSKDTFFIHARKQSTKKLNKFVIAKNVEKNTLTNFFISWDKKTMLLLLPLFLFELIYSHAYLLLSVQWDYELGKITGAIEFILSINSVIKQRRIFQKKKIKEDKALISIFVNSKSIQSFSRLTPRNRIFSCYRKYLSFFFK